MKMTVTAGVVVAIIITTITMGSLAARVAMTLALAIGVLVYRKGILEKTGSHCSAIQRLRNKNKQLQVRW